VKINSEYTRIKKLIENIKSDLSGGTFTTDELGELIDDLGWLVELASNKDSED
jgi:hypothetical protein